MKSTKRSFWRILVGFTFRSTVLHIATYMVIGGLAFHFMTHHYDETSAGMQDLHGEHVMHWFFVAQIVRGILLGLVLFPLRRALLDMNRWGGLVIGGILFYDRLGHRHQWCNRVMGLFDPLQSQPFLFICRRL